MSWFRLIILLGGGAAACRGEFRAVSRAVPGRMFRK
jgi:hypothetical protein